MKAMMQLTLPKFVFFRGVNDDMCVSEELIDLQSLKAKQWEKIFLLPLVLLLMANYRGKNYLELLLMMLLILSYLILSYLILSYLI